MSIYDMDCDHSRFRLDESRAFLSIVSQLGLDVDGIFNIHIWACSGDFIVRNRLTDNFALM